LLCGQRTGKLDSCEHWFISQGKQCRISFSIIVNRTKGTLDYIHSDVWGLSQVPSKGKAHFLLTSIDDFSRKVWVYPLKHKSDMFSTFTEWKVMIEK